MKKADETTQTKNNTFCKQRYHKVHVLNSVFFFYPRKGIFKIHKLMSRLLIQKKLVVKIKLYKKILFSTSIFEKITLRNLKNCKKN